MTEASKYELRPQFRKPQKRRFRRWLGVYVWFADTGTCEPIASHLFPSQELFELAP